MAAFNVQCLDFFDWWLDDLRGAWTRVVPGQKQSSASDWIISLADDGIQVVEAGAPQFQSIPLPLDSTAEEISMLFQTGRSRKQPTFDILIQPSLFLTRQLATRRLPLRQARTMADLDLLASTPIDPAQVHLVFAKHPEQGCSYHVVKTKTLAAVLDAVRRTGGTVGSLALADANHGQRADNLSMNAIWPPTARDRCRRIAWIVAGSVLAGAVLFTYSHKQWRYWQASAELDARIADAQVSAKAARASLQKRQTGIEQVEKIRNEKKTSASLVRVWAELTRLLPDTAWLTDLSSKGGNLTITGFSTSAAELIEPLDASSLFAAPEFAAPVVKVPGQDGERFTITAKIGAL
ncbi:MAG: fimbrial assembly protein [Mesorhizobium sp.]|nr:MAG: fimbrial assembly protein [Mesorhizobium sp.]